jgi:hypothetical protein
MAKKAKKRLSAAHRKALSDGQKRRWKRERSKPVPVPAVARTNPPSPASRGGRKRGVKKMPEGLHLLLRNGGGMDIIKGNACEISAAVRFWRETKAKFAK